MRISPEMEPEEGGRSRTGDPSEGWRRNWRHWGTWAAISVGCVLLYFFIYPIPLIYLDDSNGVDLESQVPGWLYAGIRISVLPLIWMMEAVPFYGEYIELADEWVTR